MEHGSALRPEARRRPASDAASIFHLFAQRIQRTAGGRKWWESKGCTVGGKQGREFFAVRAEQNWEFRLSRRGRSNGFKANIERQAEFEDASFVYANKGCPVDMTRCRVFRFNQYAVAVPGGLKQGDQVFAGGVVFPHSCG